MYSILATRFSFPRIFARRLCEFDHELNSNPRGRYETLKRKEVCIFPTRFLLFGFISARIRRMVKFARLGALATLCGGLANAEQPWLSGGLLKGVLTRFGVNSSFIDSALSTEFVRPAALHVVDITDENWETVLRTGAEDPFGKSLEDDTTWVRSFSPPSTAC